MAQPTLTNVFDECRSRLGDDEISGGQIYTDTVLLYPAQAAVRELFKNMRNFGVGKVVREAYYVLPADTSVLQPVTAGITDLSAPIGMGERGGLTSVTITGAVQSGSGLNITAVNSFADGDYITLNGMGGIKNASGIFGISNTTGSGFTAGGVISTGTYTSGGVAVKSTDEFRPMTFTDVPFRVSSAHDAQLNSVQWREERFYFPVCNEDRQLRIIYYSSADVPTTGADIITIDDSLDFLALWASSVASLGRGAESLSAMLRKQAVGSAYDEGRTAGALKQLLAAAVRDLQNRPVNERSRGAYRTPMPMFGYMG